MFDLLSRLQDHARDLAGRLDSEEVGGELVRAVLGFARAVVRFIMTAGAATQNGTSLKPLIEDAPVALQTLSDAMPTLADLLFNPETWETSVIEISESDRWRQTTELAMALIDRVLEESVDVLMGDSEREWPLVETFTKMESSLDEVIETYLNPLLGSP